MDGLVYRAGFSAEQAWYDVYQLDLGVEAPPIQTFRYKKDCNHWIGKDQDLYNVERRVELAPLRHALGNLKTIMNNIRQKFPEASITGFLSGASNFRDRIGTIKGYKANRVQPKPTYYQDLRTYLIDNHGAVAADDQEADDEVSIIQWQDWKTWPLVEQEAAQTCIVTNDKDLDNVPGWHFNWVKKEVYFVEELTATRNFYKQLLKGDGTDNIPGLYYITGEMCKAKYLNRLDTVTNESNMYYYVREVYIEALAPELEEIEPTYIELDNILQELGQLLWMRSKPDELWEPPV